MTDPPTAPPIPQPEVPALDRPGSAARAWLGCRATTAALLPLWFAATFVAQFAVEEADGWEGLIWIVVAMLAYIVATMLVIPAFAFTVGRWIDRRTAARSRAGAVMSFAAWGAGLGLLSALVIAPAGGIAWLGFVAVALAPAIAAAVGRLLVDARGAGWTVLIWTGYVAAIALALLIVGNLLLSRWGVAA